jgi:hypothetical protein
LVSSAVTVKVLHLVLQLKRSCFLNGGSSFLLICLFFGGLGCFLLLDFLGRAFGARFVGIAGARISLLP